MNKNINTTDTKSKRSIRSGPNNPNDARYRRNEKSIHRTLEKALARRRINVQAREIYQDTKIASATFYLHCRGSDDALRAYEHDIITDFHDTIQQTINPPREVIFIVLLNLIHRHHGYFSATLTHNDCWMLAELLDYVRLDLVGPKISDKCYDVYAGQLSILIFCWGKHDHFQTERIPFYTKKLMQTRVMNLGL